MYFPGVNNPWKVKISYHNVAPWIGPNSRKNNVIPNTEYKKGAILKQTTPTTTVPRFSHDDIINALLGNDNVSYFK